MTTRGVGRRGGWAVPGAPADSGTNGGDWRQSASVGFVDGVGVQTRNSLYLGFGLEGVTGATNRATLSRVAQALVDGGKLMLQCLNPYQIEHYLESFRSGWHQIAGGYMLREARFAPRTATLEIVTPLVSSAYSSP